MEPTTPQPTRETYEKVFNLFIGHDNDRPDLMQPFRQDGFYYATDAVSLIFIPVAAADLPFQDQDKPVPARIIPKAPTCNIAIVVADLERQLVPDMIAEMEQCDRCDGEGTQECDLGHEHECTKCRGEGEVISRPARQIADPSKQFQLDGVLFQYKQLRRLIDACRVLGCETITKTNGAGLHANLFKCGTAGVLVMPCLVDEPDYMEEGPVEIIITPKTTIQ